MAQKQTKQIISLLFKKIFPEEKFKEDGNYRCYKLACGNLQLQTDEANTCTGELSQYFSDFSAITRTGT